MLERLIIRNFKQFDEVEIELGQAVVFVGPNNAGKTSALQALALWDLGVRRWHEKHGEAPPSKRTGVPINRRDLTAIPVPDTNLMWRGVRAHQTRKENGKPKTHKVPIVIEVHGIDEGKQWQCGMEFDYANAESLHTRPISRDPAGVPSAALGNRVAFLPPMSGLTANETRIDHGAVQVRLGEGRTAEVLRNLCYELAASEATLPRWRDCKQHIHALFGVDLDDPEYVQNRGELLLTYRDRTGSRLDISSAGRGLQQTLLLLAFLFGNPGSVLLLDEPDAHLEVLRQEQIYQLLTTIGQQQRCQILAASHSEVLLQAAADRDMVIAFVGKPHRIDDRGSQVLKALRSIRFDHYHLAERAGFVLYLEGSTDLAILRAFAATLRHPAAKVLARPFTHEVGNVPKHAYEHFGGLREALPNLVGYLLLDRRDGGAQHVPAGLTMHEWQRREIENYLCFPSVLTAYARELAAEQGLDLFQAGFVESMQACVAERIPPAATGDLNDPFWRQMRASEGFLDVIFEKFFARLKLPNLMRKSDYHRLASLVPAAEIDAEVTAVLDAIVAVASKAQPMGE